MQNPTLENHQQSTISEDAQLVNRIATSKQQAEFLEKADSLPRIQLDKRATSDLETIANGGFSQLQGFLEQADYESVVENMRLANGQPWSIPVTLSVSEEVAASLKEGSLIRLDDPNGGFIGALQLTQKYRYDKTREAVKVYRTEEDKHPGVKVVYEQGEVNLAGPVWLLQRDEHSKPNQIGRAHV